MMPGMDQIPIGEKGGESDDREPDNVVHLPSSAEQPNPDTAPQTQAPAGDEEMSWEKAVAADQGGEPEDEQPRPPPGSAIAELLEQGVRVGAGLFSAGASAFADALRSSMPKDAPEPADDPVSKVAGAGMGAAVAVAEAAASAAGSAADTVSPLLSWIVNPPFLRGASETAAGAGRVLDGQWQAAQVETVHAATAFLSALIPEIAGSLLDEIDLTALIRDHVDLNTIVDLVDIDRIVQGLDMDAIIARVDMESVARTFPLDPIMERVDPNPLVAKVDIEGVIESLDLAAIAQEVIEEIDLPSIIRESSGAMASETVQTVRVQSMNADRLVSRIVDKVLRRDARDLVAAPKEAPEDAATPDPGPPDG
jgi:hypothetical protein